MHGGLPGLALAKLAGPLGEAFGLDLSRTFERLVVRSGLPKIRLHDLRHTHASLLLKAGVPIKVVSERLGHATPSLTLDVYGWVLPGMQAEAATVFSRLMSAKPVGATPPHPVGQSLGL